MHNFNKYWGALIHRFSDKMGGVAEALELECMHVKENKIDDISHVQHCLKLKKIYKSQTKHQN
jgi:hypothetical protein